METEVNLLTWHCFYGGYTADGYLRTYTVIKDSNIGWVAMYHPLGECTCVPGTLVPFGRTKDRRTARRRAEEFERDSR